MSWSKLALARTAALLVSDLEDSWAPAARKKRSQS
jgi:hypothetical protein